MGGTAREAAMAFMSYAQNFEDVTLWRALRDVEAGFYIDVGAWDPDVDSVTRAFSERGWRGVNVEPLPGRHAALQARRPRDVNLLAAVGAAAGTATFYDVEASGLSTLDPALAAAAIQTHGLAAARRTVQVTTLAEICRAHAPDPVHFLKIDVEGAERAVLEGADFTRYRPWIVLLEALDPRTLAPNHQDWEDLLAAAGYRFAWFDALNRFYVAQEHHARLEPLLAQPPNLFDGFVRAVPPALAAPAAPAPASDPLAASVPASLDTEARTVLAQECRDCDGVPKVADAGQVLAGPDGTLVQVMHNGLRVPADGYCGPWMTRLIQLCRGHHEPQEERLFHEALRSMPRDAAMIEVGGNWSYYSAWFLQGEPARRAVVLEPDPANRAVGETTMRLNGLRAAFVAAYAGAAPAPPAPFDTERSGTLLLPCMSVPQVMADHGITHLDLLHLDAQGAELAVLQGCADSLRTGTIGAVFVSTHVHQITGDPLTHQRCLALLRGCGALIEAEHDPYESFSGDGLIVARLGPAPAGWHPTAISRARAGEALFRHPSFDLAEAQAGARAGALSSRRVAEGVVTGLFDVLLSRTVEGGGLEHFTRALLDGYPAAALLRDLLGCPDFAAQRGRFAAEWLGGPDAGAGPQPPAAAPALPPGSPFACAAVEMVLERDTPLGAAGELLVLPHDEMILPAVLATGAWAPEHVAFAAERFGATARNGGPRPVLLDIGANVGLFTRQVLRAVEGIPACHCVEPDPGNFRALRRNLEAAEGRTAVHTYNLALGAADGTAPFFRDGENCGNFSLHADAMRGRPFTSGSVTVAAAGPWLERHLDGDGPVLWKSDTQGNDEVVVAQAPWPLWRRVEAAVIELWRIRKEGGLPAGFLERVTDMPHRRLGGAEVSPDGVAAYLAGDDWAHEDLFLWR